MPLKKYTVSRDDSIYEAFPDVVLTNELNLICVFAECTHHADRSYTRIVFKESNDRGRTWGEKKYLSQATKGFPYWNCPRISLLSDNVIAIVCDKIHEREENRGVNYIWFSYNQGKDWEGPYETPVKGIVPSKLTELSSGRWLLSAHDKNLSNGFLEQKLWYSDDKGKQWIGPVDVAGTEGLNLCEGSILELPDNTIVIYLRENSNEGYDCYKAISHDRGLSFEGPYRVPLPGCHRPVAGMLQSGKIMITYRFMQGGKGWVGKWTQNFFASITDIESAKEKERNEQWSRIMPVDYDKSSVSDLGYSGWVQFPDGEIYMVNYIVDDAPKAHIRGYSLWENDFGG